MAWPYRNFIVLSFPKVFEHKLSHLIQRAPIAVNWRCKTYIVWHLALFILTWDNLWFIKRLKALKDNVNVVSSTIWKSFGLGFMLYSSMLQLYFCVLRCYAITLTMNKSLWFEKLRSSVCSSALRSIKIYKYLSWMVWRWDPLIRAFTWHRIV